MNAKETGRSEAAILVAAVVGLLAACPGPAGEAPDIQFVEPEEAAPGPPALNPFAPSRGRGPEAGPSRRDAVPGRVIFSDGREVRGHIYTTRAKRLKIYNLRRKIYEYVPVPACRKIEAVVEWERMEQQWRFKEAGSPEKVFTGKAYPVRSLAWRLTLVNGHQITGHILGQPLYVEHDGKRERLILHQRQKGPLESSLETLIFPRAILLGDDAGGEKGGEGRGHERAKRERQR